MTSGPEVKGDGNNLSQTIQEECEFLKNEFTVYQKISEDALKSLADDPIYKSATTWKIPDNTVKTCSYVSPAVGDLNTKSKRIKDLYSNNNLNDNKKTFNGKVTFN